MADVDLLALDSLGQEFKELVRWPVEEQEYRGDQNEYDSVRADHVLNGLSERRFIQGGFRRVFLFVRAFHSR